MTGRELIELLDNYPLILAAFFVPPPVTALVFRFLHKKEDGGNSPWKYLYAFLIYYVSAPGILAGVVVAYTLFFTKESLLDMSLLVSIFPVLTMVVTLLIMSRSVDFGDIPGFDRLWGLFVMIALTFGIVLAISKTRIWLLFGGSIWTFVAMAAFLFALLKWGAYMAFRRRSDPKRDPPEFSRPD